MSGAYVKRRASDDNVGEIGVVPVIPGGLASTPSLSYSFAGKRVLVTGGGQGLGLELVRRLYYDNAHVFILEKNPESVSKLRLQFPRARSEVCDIREWDVTQSIIKSFGAMDHLINNAGIMITANFASVTESQVDDHFAVNVKAVYCVTQAVSEEMIKAGVKGTIVNVGSITAHMAVEGLAVYGVSKAALTALTKQLALELGKDGIRCNCVAPTSIDGSFFISCLHPPGLVPSNDDKDDVSFRARTPLKGRSKLLSMEETVNTILYLLSPLSSMTNGVDIPLDGGIVIC